MSDKPDSRPPKRDFHRGKVICVKALVSMVLGLSAFKFHYYTGIPAAILGLWAVPQILFSGGRLTGLFMAIAGLLVGGGLAAAKFTGNWPHETQVVAAPEDTRTELERIADTADATLKELGEKRSKLDALIVKLESQRGKLVAKIKGLGIRGSSDLEGNAEANVLAKELVGIEKDLRTAKRNSQSQHDAIISLESKVRTARRKIAMEELEISDEDLMQQLTTEIELQHKLTGTTGDDVAAEIEASEVLNSLLSE